jgi:hypothetical protein
MQLKIPLQIARLAYSINSLLAKKTAAFSELQQQARRHYSEAEQWVHMRKAPGL